MMFEPLTSLENAQAAAVSVEFEAAVSALTRFVKRSEPGAQLMPEVSGEKVSFEVTQVPTQTRMHELFDHISTQVDRAGLYTRGNQYRLEMSVADFMRGFVPAALRQWNEPTKPAA